MYIESNERLTTSFGSISMSNPIMVGCGPSTTTISDIKHAEDAGAGGIYIKSIGSHQDTPYGFDDRRRYRHIKGFGTYLKSTYLKEILSIDHGIRIVRQTKEQCQLAVIASVFYPQLDNEEDFQVWRSLIKTLEESGADGIQIDFFYMDLRKLSKERIDWLVSAVCRLNNEANVPVFPKLNIGMDEDLQFAFAFEESISGLVFVDSINTHPYIDIYDQGRPIYDGTLYDERTGRPHGVIAGDPLLHYTFSMTQKLRARSSASLSAGGGLNRWEDIVRCLMLGASSVHLTSSVMRRGFRHISKLSMSILKFMDEQGYMTLKDVIGKSLIDPKASTPQRVKHKEFVDQKVRIIQDKCIDCAICEHMVTCDSFKSTPYDFETQCDGCSMCVNLCPTKALVIEPVKTRS